MTGFSRAVPLPVEEAELRSHLFIWHAQWTGDVKTLEGLIECHEDYEHGTEASPVQTHMHTAPAPMDEWSWT